MRGTLLKVAKKISRGCRNNGILEAFGKCADAE
jgi:hypothetical protein